MGLALECVCIKGTINSLKEQKLLTKGSKMPFSMKSKVILSTLTWNIIIGLTLVKHVCNGFVRLKFYAYLPGSKLHWT